MEKAFDRGKKEKINIFRKTYTLNLHSYQKLRNPFVHILSSISNVIQSKQAPKESKRNILKIVCSTTLLLEQYWARIDGYRGEQPGAWRAECRPRCKELGDHSDSWFKWPGSFWSLSKVQLTSFWSKKKNQNKLQRTHSQRTYVEDFQVFRKEIIFIQIKKTINSIQKRLLLVLFNMFKFIFCLLQPPSWVWRVIWMQSSCWRIVSLFVRPSSWIWAEPIVCWRYGCTKRIQKNKFTQF